MQKKRSYRKFSLDIWKHSFNLITGLFIETLIARALPPDLPKVLSEKVSQKSLESLDEEDVISCIEGFESIAKKCEKTMRDMDETVGFIKREIEKACKAKIGELDEFLRISKVKNEEYFDYKKNIKKAIDFIKNRSN